MEILLVKASNVEDVRLQKFIKVFKAKSYFLEFIGWKRRSLSAQTGFIYPDITYLSDTSGKPGFLKPLVLLIWTLKVFIYLLKKSSRYNYVYCADFEAAFPVYIASYFRKIDYVYDIYDQFNIRHTYPALISKALYHLDLMVRARAHTVIHVDEVRLSDDDDENKTIVIYNSPLSDFQNESERICDEVQEQKPLEIAVTGYLASTRGLGSIFKFMLDNPGINFIIAGPFYDKKVESKIKQLDNVDYIGSVSQAQLFARMLNVSAIFSLYDPSIKINKLAASNKVYDAMSLGAVVIINEEILAAEKFRKLGVCLTVPYIYDRASWSKIAEQLKDVSFVSQVRLKGKELLSSKFSFEKGVDRLIERMK